MNNIKIIINNNNSHEHEITILENIHNQQDVVRQRDLAEIAGLSLGMTNSILKRLASLNVLLKMLFFTGKL